MRVDGVIAESGGGGRVAGEGVPDTHAARRGSGASNQHGDHAGTGQHGHYAEVDAMSLPLPHRPAHPGLLFQHLRWRMWSNTWREMRVHSLVRPITILLSSLIVIAFAFAIS